MPERSAQSTRGRDGFVTQSLLTDQRACGAGAAAAAAASCCDWRGGIKSEASKLLASSNIADDGLSGNEDLIV